VGTDYSIKRDGSKAQIFLFPKQEQFIKSECDEVFFGGAAGPGKSYALLMLCLQRRLQHPKSTGLLLRRKFPELERSLIMKSRQYYPMFGAKYNGSNHTWRFPNGSVQEFGHMEHEHTVHDYQSAEYNDICFDEASHFSEFQIRYMLSRLRTGVPGCKSLFRLASNPGGVSHGFLKRRYVQPSKTQKIWTDPETGHRLTFIAARLRDNPALMDNDPGYEKRLRGLPEKQRRALLDGDWDVFEGQFFNEWDENLHVLKKAHAPSPNTQKFISVDWGFAAPAAVYWHELLPVGRVITYRELYVTLRSPKELGKDILDLTPEEEQGFRGVILPPETFGKKVELEDGGVPIADLMSQVLRQRFVILKANNARVAGWTKMREYMMMAPDGLPWWQISPACVNLIRTLPDMIYDDVHVEDMNSDGEDHPCLIGCTEVLTKNGKKPIMDLVGTTGEIWTPSGWKKYFNCRRTKKNTSVVRVTLSSGLSFVATPDHRILTQEGWKEICELKKTDLLTVNAWTTLLLFQIRFKNFLESGIIGVENIFKETVYACIGLFGQARMGKFLKDLISTIKITIDSITGYQIYSVSMQRSTSGIICLQKNEKHLQENSWKEFDHSQRSGIAQKQEEAGIGNTQKMCGGKERRRFPRYVKNVIRRFGRLFPIVRDFAISIVKCLFIENTTPKSELTTWNTIEPTGNADVYNLEVEDVHCFSINGGVVVHNCDSCRYFFMALNNVPRIILSPHGVMGKIFGTKDERQLSSNIPLVGRSGYGI
jgi:hypothetical protein